MFIVGSITLRVYLLIVLAVCISVGITIIPTYIQKPSWDDKTHDQLVISTLTASQTENKYIAMHISKYFDQAIKNLKAIESYIFDSTSGQLNVVKNYDTYYGVSTVDARKPLVDYTGKPFFSTTFMKGLVSTAQYASMNQYIVHGSTIYDNVFRATVNSGNEFISAYIGFEENGFFRRYPHTRLDNYETLSYVCYYNNQNAIGYDPRCRIWYAVAINDDKIHFTSYIDSQTNIVTVTASKRILNNSKLMGVIGMDFRMKELNDLIALKRKLTDTNIGTQYTFLMDNDGMLIAYPNIVRTRTYTVFEMETNVSGNVWTNIINEEAKTKSMAIIKGGQKWTLTYTYLPTLDYYVITLYANSDIDVISADIANTTNYTLKITTIVVSCVGGLCLVIGLCYVCYFGIKQKRILNELRDDIKNINESNLELITNKQHTSLDMENIYESINNFLIAVKFGNMAYFNGDMYAALNLYNDAENLIKSLSLNNSSQFAKALSSCYNNKGNVYNQMGDYANAEKYYLAAIDTLVNLIETDVTLIESKKITLRTNISQQKMNLGVLYSKSNRLQDAKKLLEESLKLANQVCYILPIDKIDKHLAIISKISEKLCHVYIALKDIDKATELADEIYNLVRYRASNTESIQYAMLNLASVELFKNNYKDAGCWITRIMKDQLNIDSYVEQTCFKYMYTVLINLGEEEQANIVKNKIITTDKPKDVLFVLDCTGTFNGQIINQCNDRINKININNDLNNKVSMVIFNNDTHWITKDNYKMNDVHNVIRTIMNTNALNGTAFYDGLVMALQQTSLNDVSHDKWLVAFTDKTDTQSKNTIHDVFTMLDKKAPNLIIITLGNLENKSDLQAICDIAGGELIEIDRMNENINEVFNKIEDILNNN